MRIANNVPALSAFNSLNSANNNLQKVIKQVSTGLRINSAADDAAGLAISENMRAQSTGLERSIKNAQDGISLLQTAEGALGETNSMLQRMRELAVQAANDTLTSQDRNFLQMEIDNLKDSINRIADTTQFNTKFILDGSSCGKCESTETTTKGYIKGAIDIEGNYKIQVRAKPGQAQVQKSTIFKVCNENVVTNQQLNANNGIGNVAIDNLPAGDYNITATQAGGGEVTNTYKRTAIVEASSGNTSTKAETLRITLNGEDLDGKKLYWPTSTSSTSRSSYYRIISIPSGKTEAEIAQLIANEINNSRTDGKLKLMSAGRIGEESAVEFEAEAKVVDGKCEITLTSTEGLMTSPTIRTIPGATTEISSLTQDNSGSFQQNTASIQPEVERGNEGTDPETLTVTISSTVNGNTETKEFTHTIAAGASQSDIANIFKTYSETATLNGKTVKITGKSVPGKENFFRLEATDDTDSNISISLSLSSANDADKQTKLSSLTSNSTARYTTKYDGTVTAGNTSQNTERIELDYRHTNLHTLVDVDVPAGTKEPKDIAALIKAKISEQYPSGEISIDGDKFSIVCDVNDASFSLQAIGASRSVSFNLDYISATGTTVSATTIKEPEMRTDDPAPEVATSALVSSSQFYCSEEAAESISPSVNSKTQNNASMIFEVTGKTYDQAAGGYVLTLSAASNVLTADGNTARYSDDKIIISTGNKTVNIGSLLGEDESHMSLTLDPDKFEVGNKFVYNVSGNGTTATPVTTSLYMSHQQDAKWPQAWEWEEPYETTYPSSGPYFNVNADSISNREIHFRNFYLNTENGNVIDSDIKLAFNEDFGKRAASFPDAPEDPLNRSSEISLASFTSNYPGKVADGSTKLRDLDQFYNKSGVFMLEEPQKITITQNDGKKTQITLYGTDTLNDVAKKLNDAIADDLGQGMYVRGGDANKIVTFVENPTEGTGLETVEGTFIIRSLIPGTAGELTFSSSYGELIDNLGLNTVQHSEEGYYNVSVSNAHTGEIITGNVKIMGNMLRGVIHENIDVEFDPMAGVSAVWSEDDKNFILVPDEKAYTTFLHVVKNNISFHTGANEGEKIQLDIGDMTAAGLGLKSVSVTTAARAERSITLLDETIRRISAQRAKIGAYENALEHTIENLTTSNTNLISSVSRIRDADISKSMLDLVKYQIIHQAGTSMLAQANQLPQSVLNLIQ